jgi:cell division septation protein DedD
MSLVPRIHVGFPIGWCVVATAAVLAVTPAYGDVVKGIEAYRNGDFDTALKEFQADAEADDKRAQYNLGVMLLKGNGVQKDIETALKWHRRSAEQGYAAAQHGLGVMYYRGDGVAQDQGEAAKWFRKAAEQGFAQAELNLGVIYFTGQGLPKDGAEVVKWITLAAAKGLAEAQFRLGTLYTKGLIFRADPQEAIRWFEKAAKQGHIKSIEALAAIKSPTTSAESDAKEPAADETDTDPASAASAPTSGWRVQLASFRTAAEAELAWRRLKNRLPELFGGLKAETVEADLGPKRGVYHRLSAGPLDDRAAARALCRDIKERVPRQGCLPVSR